MASDRTLRVLLIAEQCNPSWTSVPLVGYNVVRGLSTRPDLQITLVTHIRNRSAIEATDLGLHVDVQYINNEFVARPVYKLARWLRGGDQLSWTIDTAMAWPSYVVFEKMLQARYGAALARGDYDLVHRVTPLSPTAVSPMAERCPVPMIAGPLNGGLPWPKEFPELVRKEKEWLVPLRKCYTLLPYHRSTYRHLTAIIAASQATASQIPNFFHGSTFHLPENGVDPNRFPIADHWPEPQGKFRFITAGRIVPYKGLALTLEAIKRSPILKQSELIVVGDGPDRPALEQFVTQNGLNESVRFLGQLPQERLSEEMRRSQVFVFPSLREFGGGVVLEAMACGLPPLIVDYGGPTELLTAKEGIKISMQPREPLIESLKSAMEGCVRHPEKCREMGNAAVQAVRERYTWDAKARQIEEIYREVLASKKGPGRRKAIDAISRTASR
jgi:glycosyltransferase involved in cell wall biosynthesis